MTLRLQTILTLFIILILVFSSALAGEKQPKNSVSAHGKKLKTIIVAEYYPYTFVNKEGLPDGFSVDLAKAVAQVMDLNLEITVDTWENAQNALKTGRIDFLPMMAYSKKRDRDFDFSAPHTIAYDAFFFRKGILPIHSGSELTDKTVIVMNKDQGHDYLISTGLITSDRFILVDSLPDALRILSSGRGDVAIMPKLIGLLHIKRSGLTNIDSSPVVIDSYTRPFSFAVKEGDLALLEKLSQGLNIIKSTGQYKTIYLKWFGIIDPPGLPTKTVMISAAIFVVFFAIIAVVILLWTFALRKQVALRTQHLEQEIKVREMAEEALREREKQVRQKLDTILSLETDMGALELADLIDIEKLQKLMDKFYQLTNIGIGIIDLHGRVLVGTGWQDVCTKFHRMNPESCRLCIESDLELSRNIPVGSFKQYRCGNNMWDIATPIMLRDRHVGNIFLGQFLFDDETPDYETFRQQAHRYGFNEQKYIEALDQVPRWSRETVNAAMSFYAALAEMIGNLSYSNIKLVNALEERKQAEEALARVNRALRMLIDINQALLHITDEATLLNEVSRIAVDVGGYRMAWVGFAEHDEAKTLRPVAHAGFDSGYIESANVTWADDERGRGPGGTAIRTGQPCIVRNISLEPAFAPWREAALQRSYKSIIALPLISEGQTLGAMGIYAGETDAFDAREVEILEELADNLAFGITMLRTRAERDLAEEALQHSEKQKTILNEIANIFLTIPDEAMYGDVLEVVLRVTGSKYGIFGFIDKHGNLTIPSLTRDIWNECQIPGKSIVFPTDSWGESLWGRAIREKKAFYSGGPFHTPEGHVHIDHFLTAPVVFGQEAIGLISIANKEGEYTEDDKDLLESITGYVSPILHARLQRDRLERERGLAVEALRGSEEKYRGVVENIGIGIALISPNMEILALNNQMQKWFPNIDVSKKPICHKAFNDPPRDSVCSYCPTYKTIEDGQIRESITETPAGNETRYYRIVSSPIKDKDGKINAAIEMVEDFTERKWMEAKLKEAYDIITRSPVVAFLWKNVEGWPVEFVTDNVENLFGYTAEEFTSGKVTYAGTVHPDDLERVAKEVADHIKEKEKIAFDHEPYRIATKDGKTKWVNDSTFIRRNEKGEITHYQGILTDITDRKSAEEQKKKLEAQLNQAQKMEAIGTLAGGIAHDFNNLLMTMQGNASMMMEELDPSHPHNVYLKSIDSQIRSAANLTRQLLGFAREGRYDVKPTDINEIVEKAAFMFGRTKKEIQIQRTYGKDLWLVETDADQMGQVLMNLFVNAWQAMPGGGDLFLETQNVVLDEDYIKPYMTVPGRYVKISVTDTGVGMDEKTMQRIFEPFFTTKERSKGTGLGLSMVYGIVKGHKGFINVYSEPGHGTTFNIYLPASEKEISPEISTSSAIIRGTGTILLVDDEATVLKVSQRMLERLGYTVMAARSGKAAFDLYGEKKEEIDLVLLDMIMPEMSGEKVFQILHEMNPNVKVILLSGYSINGRAQNIIDSGCNGFLQKPVSLSELSQKVHEVLSMKKEG